MKRIATMKLIPYIILIYFNILMIVASLITERDAFAANWDPLQDTGQTTCYDSVGNNMACPNLGETLYGQDANYSGQSSSYTSVTVDNDEIVVDNNSNLIWQQSTADVNGDGEVTYYDDVWADPPGYGDRLSIGDAINYCSNLTFAGFSDWYLPVFSELESLIDYGRFDPTIDPVFDCVNTYHWTNSLYAGSADEIWTISFYTGAEGLSVGGAHNFVRCVRNNL